MKWSNEMEITLMKKTLRLAVLLFIIPLFVSGCSLDSFYTDIYGYGVKNRMTALAPVSKQENPEYIQIDEVSDVKVNNAQDAIHAMNNFRSLGLEKAEKEFEPLYEDALDDLTYYRCTQTYEGISVYGRSMVTVTDGSGAILTLIGNYTPLRDINAMPDISAGQAIQAASDYIHGGGFYAKSNILDNQGLTIYSLNTEPALCWMIQASYAGEGGYASKRVFVNANNGEINAVESSIHGYQETEILIGQTGTRYDIPYVIEPSVGKTIFDEERNISAYTFDYRDISKEHFDFSDAKKVIVETNNKSAADAVGNLIATYDFYKLVLDRDQYDGNGSELSLYVNLIDSKRRNQAFYLNGKICFTIPFRWLREDSKNLDVVAHEFTHGVSRTTAGFVYAGQSGAISEAISDIFAELVLKDALAIINTDDLRFTAKEIKEIFEKNNQAISKKQADEIYASTGGWIIGLRALLISGRESFGAELSGQYLEAFLKTHVWKKWDKKSRDYMMKSSVVEELTPGLWQTLTGAGLNSLVGLANENAFLRLVGDNTYRFHDLFRLFLLNMLEQEGETAKKRQMKKAGDWFYKHKDYYRAVKYYLKCGDTEGISKGLKLMYNYNSPYASIEDTVAIIHASVNDVLISKFPFLLETLVWAAYVEGRSSDMENYLDRYYKLLPKIILQNPASAQTSMLLRMVDHRNSMIDVTKSLKKLPLKLFSQANTPSLSQNMPLFHRSCKDFSEYVQNLEENLHLFKKTIGVLIGGECETLENLIKAGLTYERGNLNDACEYAISANTNLKENFAPETMFCAYMILAAILNAQGDRPGAQNILEKTDSMIERHKAYYLHPNLRAFKFRLNMSEGDINAARSWLNDYGGNPLDHLKFYELYRHITSTRAYIVIGDYNSAVLISKKLLMLCVSYKRPLDIMEVCILLAIAYWRKGGSNQNTALDFLRQAIIMANQYGYTQLFVNEGASLLTMLHKLHKRAVQANNKDILPAASIKSLYLSAVAASKHSKGLTGKSTENLSFTTRQRTVIRLLCEGFNRKEIAERMGISPDGVKSHMNLIFKKLDVTGSIEAVVKIKELNLIPSTGE